MIVGYARVSTIGQDHAGQVAELKAAGCEKIYAESASGAAGRRRPQLMKAIFALGAGDLFIVTRLNRLARSARDALNLLAEIGETGSGFRSLGEPWADTTSPAGRLMVTLFVGLAEFDREMILERTSEGRTAARARGVKMGRPAALSAKQIEFIREARAAVPGKSIGELQDLLEVSRSTIVRATREDPAVRTRPQQIDLETLIDARRLDLDPEPSGVPDA